jgi:hypothetical protein
VHAGTTTGGERERARRLGDPAGRGTVVISRRLGGIGAASASGGGDSAVHVRVATFLTDAAPPKVIALLKVVFPLPDIIVVRLQARCRAVNPQGIARPSCDLDAVERLVLTAKEIKGVVLSMGLWLVVRESIGCAGKISRRATGGIYAHTQTPAAV